MTNFGDWMPGAKEAKERAETVAKRRTRATALTTDLDLELQDIQVSYDLAQKDHPAQDLKKLRSVIDRIGTIMAQIYQDVTLIADQPMPERITDQQAYHLMQPVLRIEHRASEARRWFENARQELNAVAGPRDKAGSLLEEAERERLQTEIELEAATKIAAGLEAGRSENAPQALAASQTARSETQTASQLLSAGRLALSKKSWREAHDLAQRAAALFASARDKCHLIRQAGQEHEQASGDAGPALEATLRQLAAARERLSGQTGQLSFDPAHYLQPAVQRLGEARRALKAEPPQAMRAARLTREAGHLIEQALDQANQEAQKLEHHRNEARQTIEQLDAAVNELRLCVNSQRTVPVRANHIYRDVRPVRDRLLAEKDRINQLALPHLIELTTEARQALQNCQEGLRFFQ